MSMKSICSKKNIIFLFFLLLVSIPIFTTIPLTFALTEYQISSYDKPDSLVLLIVDGASSCYIYPELLPETLEGEPGHGADISNFEEYFDTGFRAVDVTVPHPVTDKGHSVIVTGYRNATPEIVGYNKSTIIDSLRHEGYFCIGIMQRGDFYQMRNKFDIIMYDKTNSINKPEILIQINNHEKSNYEKSKYENLIQNRDILIEDVNQIMENKKREIKKYVSSKNISERYSGYNKWAIDSAIEIVSLMNEYPEQKYILIINAGAVDTSGHYRGYEAYIENLEFIVNDTIPLLNECKNQSTGFIFTADHGMTFPNLESRSGGHSSSKYSSAECSVKIPLIFWAENVKKETYEKPAHQQDITPTIFSLTEIEEMPRFMDGEALPIKEKVTLTLKLEKKENISIYDKDKIIYKSEKPDNAYKLKGFETKTYKINFYDRNENITINFEKDTVYDQIKENEKEEKEKKDEKKGSDNREKGLKGYLINFYEKILLLIEKIHYFALIGIINAVGIGMIYYIYKK
ncbi:MAG: sulfatase-like hydrolase/transferase [Methanosarcinaceae archaeon]|nr:sulfatase-like hydrolase/transferase [Methanosarcinaceae archaeon]